MNLTSILERAGKLRIAVVGDLIHDRYIDGVVERISPEAPVPVLKITGTRKNPGGAGNVVENLKSLGIYTSFFYDRDNTIIKTRVMSGTHHLLRMDDEENSPKLVHWDDIDINLGYGIQHKKFDCVIMSDYGKGMLNRGVASTIIRLCNENGIPTVVDTKYQQNIFFSATVLKCNQKEWDTFQNNRTRSDSEWEYMQLGDIKNLVITNGDHGMHYRGFDGSLELSGNLPGYKIDICDTCGAGDTVTAILGMMAALGEPIGDACTLANIAASEVCRHPGVYPIHKHELIVRYNELYPNHAPVQPIRLQSDAAEAQNSDQADLEGANGRGHAADEEGEKPVDAGSAQKPE